MEAIFSSLTSGAKFNKKRNAASLDLFSKAVGTVALFDELSVLLHSLRDENTVQLSFTR